MEVSNSIKHVFKIYCLANEKSLKDILNLGNVDSEVKIIAENFKKNILQNNYTALFHKEKDLDHIDNELTKVKELVKKNFDLVEELKLTQILVKHEKDEVIANNRLVIWNNYETLKIYII